MLLASCGLSGHVRAQSDTVDYKTRLIPLPNIGYSPDTRLVLGVFGLLQFKPGHAGTETRPSNAMASFAYTFKNQLSFETSYTIVFPGEKWLWNGDLFIQKWPVSYWGTGIDAPERDELTIDYKTIASRQSIYRNIGDGLYAGPLVRFRYMYDLTYESMENEPVDPPDVTGNEGYVIGGFGFGITWDKRNSILTPTENHYLEFSATWYTENLYGDYSFRNYILDARKYFDFGSSGERVLGFHLLMNLNYGEVPFREMALLGGSRIMRGYIEGRYRDKAGMQFQTEFRQRIGGRLGFVVFGALGNVAPSASRFETDQTKWAVGGGLRYNINKSDPVFIRLDYGYGHEMSGFYITLGEAF